jgi:multidrug transporter EmrE-like cation transporter
MSYFYVLCTILLTVYGQLAIKVQVLKAGALPADGVEKITFLLRLLLNPWVISAFLAALFASIAWMAAMTRLPLSLAYPFMSLAFVLVMLFSSFLFNEPITSAKLIGVLLVLAGLVVGSRG